MAIRPACHIPQADPKFRTVARAMIRKAAQTAALYAFLWGFGVGAPLILAAALGRL